MHGQFRHTQRQKGRQTGSERNRQTRSESADRQIDSYKESERNRQTETDTVRVSSQTETKGQAEREKDLISLSCNDMIGNPDQSTALRAELSPLRPPLPPHPSHPIRPCSFKPKRNYASIQIGLHRLYVGCTHSPGDQDQEWARNSSSLVHTTLHRLERVCTGGMGWGRRGRRA